MNPEPQREHAWLHTLIGHWTYETSLIDHRILRALVQEDGTWREFMTTRYRRSS